MADTHRITITIQGMSCQHCVQRVNDALEGVTGVIRADVDLDAGKASVVHTGAVSREQLASAVADAGYEVPAQT
jgi:mercuric reductase